MNAYKLIAPGTVEEKIWNLQQDKRQTISDVLGEEGFYSLDKTDLEFLFSEDCRDGEGKNGCPAGTRTPTRGTKNPCATITPRDNREGRR